jgi:hypothetical protein
MHSLIVTLSICVTSAGADGAEEPARQPTRVSIRDARWHLNDRVTYPGTQAEGLLMNVRMVNSVFEDRYRPDFLLIHFNGTKVEDIPARIAALKRHGQPIVCNEDDKQGPTAARAAELCVANGASWGLMLNTLNQYFPLEFRGADDDPVVYRRLKELTSPPAF